jgi:hypothetical protein
MFLIPRRIKRGQLWGEFFMGGSEPDECDQRYHRTVPIKDRPGFYAMSRKAISQFITSGSAGLSFRPAFHAHL